MDRVAAILTFVTIIAAGTWFQYRLSRGRMWSPLWIAFSATAASILFIVAGAIGYNLDKHSRFVAGTAWSPVVIWWEVGAGVLLAAIAAALCRLALRQRAEVRL